MEYGHTYARNAFWNIFLHLDSRALLVDQIFMVVGRSKTASLMKRRLSGSINEFITLWSTQHSWMVKYISAVRRSSDQRRPQLTPNNLNNFTSSWPVVNLYELNMVATTYSWWLSMISSSNACAFSASSCSTKNADIATVVSQLFRTDALFVTMIITYCPPDGKKRSIKIPILCFPPIFGLCACLVTKTDGLARYDINMAGHIIHEACNVWEWIDGEII